MNRPKKDFIPTSLSDLNIDAISLGSNGDRHNNNSNGARFHNLDRSKATSSFNLASQKSHHPSNNGSHNAFSRTSKMYGSSSNISSTRSSMSVNNFNINSPTSSVAVDRWEQAWEDNNNTHRPPSYQQQHSFDKSNKSFPHSHTTSDFKRSNNQSQVTSNRSMNHYSADPFDDPWSGIFNCYSSIIAAQNIAPTQLIIAVIAVIAIMVMDTKAKQHETRFLFVVCLLSCSPCSVLIITSFFMLHHQI